MSIMAQMILKAQGSRSWQQKNTRQNTQISPGLAAKGEMKRKGEREKV